MRVRIEGHDLPGRTFCGPGGEPFDDVRVGVQIGRLPEQLARGDAHAACWEIDVTVAEGPGGGLDFRGPAVHGKRGDRFLYLTWGNMDGGGHFHMFRRAKLMLGRIDPDVVRAANADGQQLVALVRLRDDRGAPRCARVDPPDISWTVARS